MFIDNPIMYGRSVVDLIPKIAVVRFFFFFFLHLNWSRVCEVVEDGLKIAVLEVK